MPAIFINTGGGDIFRPSGGGSAHLINIPSVDQIVGEGNLAMYDNVSIQVGETIQYFLTFDDVIKFIHFGKGVGSVTAEGTMYSTCGGFIPALPNCIGAIGALRGKAVYLTVGGLVAAAVFTNAQISLTNEPDTMARFIFNFAVVNFQA